ncbi:unnamed protein product [Anisakis simplex]|uniref:RIC3 domain-containing protein n=1 Tax=Anisakis simplex TaxID=6269 RepID=A0A0M3J8L5_ANISI|nr:unnamed protein product [Anisakis simplex]
MRMTAAQADSHKASSSKGMFAWMLPIYTVGVVIFLVYTLIKVSLAKAYDTSLRTISFTFDSSTNLRVYSSEESDSYEEDNEDERRAAAGSFHHIGERFSYYYGVTVITNIDVIIIVIIITINITGSITIHATT